MSTFVLVLSSPSGGGKTSIARTLLERRADLGYSVSATTRAPRPGERPGVDYHFLAREEFERRRDAGEFLEWAQYGSNLYGTLRSEVERILASGRHAVLDIEIEGARQLRRQGLAHLVEVFILPPSGAALAARLEGRNTEEPHKIAERLRLAAGELAAVREYDYAVPNEAFERAVQEVSAIIDAEARRVDRHPELDSHLAQLGRDVMAEAARVATLQPKGV